MTFTQEQLQKIHQSLDLAWKLLSKISFKSPRGRWVNRWLLSKISFKSPRGRWVNRCYEKFHINEYSFLSKSTMPPTILYFSSYSLLAYFKNMNPACPIHTYILGPHVQFSSNFIQHTVLQFSPENLSTHISGPAAILIGSVYSVNVQRPERGLSIRTVITGQGAWLTT